MDDARAPAVIAAALEGCAAGLAERCDGLVALCIGTDRSIGDALGPLVGSRLQAAFREGITVLGTLDKPVHAGNLEEALAWVGRAFRRPLVVAVDACLGRAESVGMLTVGPGSLRPGAGVSKSLPAAGDIYLTGVVNVGGFMEYFVLQNTRLSLVMRMAQVAASGLEQGLRAVLARRAAALHGD
ncbi:putative sporulation protein YyaC [Symbiobacterium terraclitae]|uniref:Sporulation protein YyaC n=1 Tax=Symbiobacterium terraclitae TaxID=557451 RepID=A0ABS4JYG1_9FIRM|nr:spore protease YyaC [Symbiobacterium terraclitae]MBP2019489.1 putative sporulation protein YyaC [Symbiobacterium terraclitae]